MQVVFDGIDARGVKSSLLAGAAILLVPTSALAQEEESQPSEQEQQRQTQADQGAVTTEPEGDVIVVSGIRASLNDALEIRRNADVVLDGISADDIGSTPDLNLGEALQRIPGVQINREAGRRDATISVRGLPGRFTKTTVMGQSIASTTRGSNVGNPFGIFDSSIFNGANVVKSFTPDIPSGGLAANVDLRINGALSRREGLVVRGEVGYEETSGEYVPAGYVSGATQIGDRLGVYGTVAYSRQNFRRDTFRVNSYNDFEQDDLDSFVAGTAASGSGDTVSATPNAAFDIPATGAGGLPNAVIYPSQIRQFTQTNDGYRVSAGAGFEYELTDTVSARVDGIFTRRDFKDANLDILLLSPNSSRAIVSPLSTPVEIGVVDYNDDGNDENVFVVPRVLVSDHLTAIGNRSFPALDQSWAVYPQLNFENDGWAINITGTYSEARGEVSQTQYDFRVRERNGAVDADGDGQDDRGTGQLAIFDSGLGVWEDVFVSNFVPDQLLNFDETTEWRLEGSTIGARYFVPITTPDGTEIGRTPISLLVAASSDGVKRDLKAIDGEIVRKFENGPLVSASFGGFYSTENTRKYRFENSIIGTQLQGLTPDIFRLSDGVSRGGDYLGGTIPGAEIDNFLSLDIGQLEDQLLPIVRTPQPGVTFPVNGSRFFPELTPESADTITEEEILASLPENPETGYLQRLPQRRVLDDNYRSKRETLELFAMGKFDFERVSSIPLRGNWGVRYVRATLSGRLDPPSTEFYDNLTAYRDANGGEPLEFREGALLAPPAASRTFEQLLPSLNLIYEITPDVVVRAAYYETFEALDLAEFSPSPTIVQENLPGEDPDDTSTEEDQQDLLVDANGDPILDEFGNRQRLDGTPILSNFVVNVSGLDIEPRKSRAFDLGISWYNRPGGVFSLGFFRKSLIDDINRFRNFCPSGQTLTFNDVTFGDLREATTGRNDGRCVFTNSDGLEQRVRIDLSQNNPNTIFVNGFEAQIQQQLDFLPGPLGNTGFVVNYTRVRSDGEDDTQLFNVAEDTYNIIGYYEDDLLQARLAWNHQSEIQLAGGSSFTGGSSRVAPRGQLDFSGAIRPFDGFEIRAEVFNITRSSRREYITFEEINRVYEYDGRTYSLSATMRF